MFRPATTLTISVLLLTSTGCTSAFRVSTGDKKPAGLPFYLKSMIYRQHTTYEYEWLRVSLTQAPILPPTKDGVEQLGSRTVLVRDLAVTSANRTLIDSLKHLVAGLPALPSSDATTRLDTITKRFLDLQDLPVTHRTAPDRSALRPSSNFVERVQTVDYSKMFYLNGKIPPFGSNNISAELAADGTLSKGASEATGGVGDAIDAISSALTGIAPVKEVLSAKWIPTTKTDSNAIRAGSRALPPLANPVSLSFRVELSVELQSITFDFTKDSGQPPSGSTLPQVVADFSNGTFTSRRSDKPPEKEASDGISFSGTIRLPEAKKP